MLTQSISHEHAAHFPKRSLPFSLHITLDQINHALWGLHESDLEFERDCTPLQHETLHRDFDYLSPSIIRIDLTHDLIKSYEMVSQAWQTLASRNEILRTAIATIRNNESRQFRNRIFKTPRGVRFGSFQGHRSSFALNQAALLVLDGSGDMPSAYLCLHPVLADQTSLGYLWKDFLMLLDGSQPISRLSYTDYLTSVNEKDSSTAEAYWRERFKDAPEVAMHAIPLERQHKFETTSSNALTTNSDSLRYLSRTLKCSTHAIICTALSLALHEHFRDSRNAAAFVVEGRNRSIHGHDSVIGFLDQEYPLRLDLDHQQSVAASISTTESIDILASSRAGIGFDKIRSAAGIGALDIKLVVSYDDEPSEDFENDFAITIVVSIGNSISITAKHDSAIPGGKIKVILDHFATALSNIVSFPDKPLAEIDIISEQERMFIMGAGMALTQPVQDSVHKVFERQVTLTPDLPAVQFETNEPLSYDQLNRIANRVARNLVVQRGSFVPVCLERSTNLVVSLIAILKAGAAYVTLDPQNPLERNKFIVDDVGADFVVVDWSTAGRFKKEVLIEDVIETSVYDNDSNLSRHCEPNDPVYVIYTSGSTGKPKGVLHKHSSATSGLAAFPTLPNLRQLFFHNPIFSAAQRSVWSTLKQGGCLCVASKENLTVHIDRTINQMQINVIDVTPSTALLITPGSVPCLRRMTVAGELINPALIPLWVNELELLNAYGLSENTQVNWRREMILGQNPQNIGRPSDTTSSYVLLPGTTKLSPLLTPGELCLGGDQLAVHYINRPEKTAEAFIENPFGSGRLYRTGDMVITHEDGSIEMVGRIDFQVKINGQRVEPGDSNTLIQTHPDVYTSGVVSVEFDGRKALVAVVVLKAEENWPEIRTQLQELLREHIPSYMMPTYWLLDRELPLNVNGKVDIPLLGRQVQGLGREHLLRASTSAKQDVIVLNGSHFDDSAPTEPSEEITKLRKIWASILSIPEDQISEKDHFQSLGGTSLDAIRAISKSTKSGLKLKIADLLRLPLGELAPKVDSIHIDKSSPLGVILSKWPKNAEIHSNNVEAAFPTSSLQDTFLADSLRGNSAYIYRRYYRIESASSEEIQSALIHLSKAHETLRTTFVSRGASFLQVTRKKAELSWQSVEISAEQFSARKKDSMSLGGNFVHFASLKDRTLAVTIHHALYDAWSNEFLLDDLVSALKGEQLIQRPSYGKYIEHIANQNEKEQVSFWKRKLHEAPKTSLKASPGQNIVVSAKAIEFARESATEHEVQLGPLIYAAWASVLASDIQQNEVVFGVTLSGRDVPVDGILDILGPTITTVPFRVTIVPGQSLVSLARTIQDDLLEISASSQLGLRKILQTSGHAAALYDSLVNIMITRNSNGTNKSKKSWEWVAPYEPNYVESTMLEAQTVDNELHLRLLSSLPLERATDIVNQVSGLLRDALRNPDDRHAYYPANESSNLSVSEKSTRTEALAHSAFTHTAQKFPDGIALQDALKSTTYKTLDNTVAFVAKIIQQHGAKVEEVVPICMQKSTNTLVAIFGVLRAGAAFTPLDPKNPKTRNDFILQDVSAKILITDNANQGLFTDFTGFVINIDNLELSSLEDGATDTTEEIAPSLKPENIAYIIYTSGSTGLPKGVQVPHSAVAASTQGMTEACNVNKDWKVLWFLNYVFDASYFDVFTVFSTGGTICVADQDTLINNLASCVTKFGVKQLMVTPTVAKLITPEDVPSLETLLVCGEPITPFVADVWASKIDVYNGYGPTEATILMTVSKVLPGGNLKSIGHPFKAVQASILHLDRMDPVPFGEIGELCVSGSQVARGYHERADLTVSAFQKADDGSVIYRTGDYARWLPNGEIECLGRKDNQIKVNGYRVELGEIESVILQNTGHIIRSCVATIAEVQHKKQIVLCYVPQVFSASAEDGEYLLSSEEGVDPSIMSEHIQSLAHYMLPRIYLPFDSFPLLPSGKTDRKRLTGIVESLDPQTITKYLPATSTQDIDTSSELSTAEEALRNAWGELFDIPPDEISPLNAFYQYGGDSIAAINLVAMMRRENYALTVNEVLSFPILREQASYLRTVEVVTDMDVEFIVEDSVHQKLQDAGLAKDDIETILPCGPGQTEFLTQGHTEDQYWQLMTVRRLREGFDLDIWMNLTRKLTAANQILRSMYLRQDENDPLTWVQIVLSKPILDIEIVECHDEEEKRRLVQNHWDQRFTLGKPFVRYLILQHVDGSMDLCIKLDHAMYDGTLLRIFDDQFTELREGRDVSPPTSFQSFLQYCKSHDRESMLSFWKEQLQDSTFTYPEEITNPRATAVVVSKINLPVDAYSKNVGITASSVFQTAYTLLLARLSRTTDVTYDYLLTGRNVNLDDPQLINGTCANFLPFRSHFDTDTALRSLLKETQSLFWQITESGLVSLGEIYRALGADRSAAAAKTLFLFQPFEPATGDQDDMRWIVMAMSKVTMYVNYAIMFEVFKDVQGHKLKMQYDESVFGKEDASAILALYTRIVEWIVENDDVAVGEFLDGGDRWLEN